MLDATQGRTAFGNEWVIIDGDAEVGRFVAPAWVTTPAAALTLWPSIQAQIDAPPGEDELYSSLRFDRDRRLADSQWMVDRHAEQLALGIETSLSAESYAALLVWRQALRDLPATTVDPAAPEWPEMPA